MYLPPTQPLLRRGGAPVLSEPGSSTPLDDGEEYGTFPTPLLWAMKEHRRLHLDLGHEPAWDDLGQGDSAVFVLDTEHRHCTAGRIVGKGPDGVVYCLVGTIAGSAYTEAAADPAQIATIFSAAHHPILVGVFEGGVSNVIDITHFHDASQIPAEYLPGHPFIDFPEDPVPDEIG
jgi:hypothetical protein